MQWLFNFMFSLVTPYIIAAWGSYTFLFYTVLDIVIAVLVFFFLKETRGRSLEEVETIFYLKAAFDVEEARNKAILQSARDDGKTGEVQEERL